MKSKGKDLDGDIQEHVNADEVQFKELSEFVRKACESLRLLEREIAHNKRMLVNQGWIEPMEADLWLQGRSIQSLDADKGKNPQCICVKSADGGDIPRNCEREAMEARDTSGGEILRIRDQVQWGRKPESSWKVTNGGENLESVQVASGGGNSRVQERLPMGAKTRSFEEWLPVGA